MGKPSLTTDRSCSGALSRHIVHRVAMHVPDQGGVHFDAVVPKMAKQNFAFPASTRTMFLNWKVKPLEVHHERQRHKKMPGPCLGSVGGCNCDPKAPGGCNVCPQCCATYLAPICDACVKAQC